MIREAGSKVRFLWWLLPALLLAGGADGELYAQEITGTTSLVFVPAARLPEDGTLVVGGGFVHRAHSRYAHGAHHYTPYFVSLVYLPRLELSFRFSRAVSRSERALGDRMISARLLLLKEVRGRPSVLVGVHDFGSTVDGGATFFNALYVVASKQMVVPLFAEGHVDLHLGYGVDWMQAAAHQFVGVFGGVALRLRPALEGLLEYDGRNVNSGTRLYLFDGHLRILLALHGMDRLVGGIAARIDLP